MRFGTPIRRLVLPATAALTGVLAAAAAGESAGTLNLTATLPLTYVRVDCPPDVPNDGRGCRDMTGRVRVRGLGIVAVKELMSPVNRTDVTGSGTLTMGARGSISFTFGGTFRLGSYSITGGTGAYAGATGSGTIHGIAVGDPNKPPGQELFPQQWSGTVIAPATEFDTTPPQLSVGKAVVKRTGPGRYRIRIPFRASDGAGGPIAYELVLRGGSRTIRATGTNATSVAVSVRTLQTTRRLVGTLTAYDDSANPTRRVVRIDLLE